MDRTKPDVDFPGETPPTELEIIDDIVGEGREAQPGDAVAVHYVGVAQSTGEQFDASWDRGEPLRFTVGTGKVIEGWDRGLLGMRVGGRRTLRIPAALAYGERGVPGVIAPGEALVFVCDLVDAV